MARIKDKLPLSTVLFIVGPTAVGKTALAVRLAKRLRGVIVSSDSMQVYKRMPALSQAPSTDDRRSVRHHLVSVVDPSKEYSVASFRRSATEAIGSVLKRGKTPIVVGGTGLYVKALIDGLFPSPKADLVFRRKMNRSVSRYGSRRLHARLARIDPVAANAIHPNDARRVIRALELYNSTGKTMTELKSNTKGLKDKYNIKIFGITMPREDIYAAADARVEMMFKDGVIREVKRLKKNRLSKTSKAVLGLKEISSYLNGESDLEAAKSLLKMNTRHLAKRQLTWFRADDRIQWYDIGRLGQSAIVDKIVRGSRG